MRIDDVLEFFSSRSDLARAIGVSAQTVSKWEKEVPKSRRESVRMAMKLRAADLRKRADKIEEAAQ